MPTIDGLQRRRVALMRRYQGQQAVLERYLKALVTAHNRLDALQGQIAVLDLALNDMLDQSRFLQTMTEHHDLEIDMKPTFPGGGF